MRLRAAPAIGFFVHDNHGAAGRAFLEALQAYVNTHGLALLREKYEQARLALSGALGLQPAAPHVKHAAVIVVAHIILTLCAALR